MNFKRGLIAGVIGTATGALLTVILIGGYTMFHWFWHNSPAMDREADLNYWRTYGAGTVTGMALFFGLSAWATYTPPGKHRFVGTLGILTLCSLLPLIFLDLILGPSPPTHKVMEHQTDWSDILFFSSPLLAVACLIVLFRWFRFSDSEATVASPQSHPG